VSTSITSSGDLPAVESPTPFRVVQVTAREPFDPVHVLGCGREEARALFHGRAVTPGEAEAIAEKTYPWRRHLHDPASYWITTSQAARVLHMTPRQVRRLLDQGRLPHVVQDSGVRLMRRRQIEAIAKLGSHRSPEYHQQPGPSC
jgi:hypothetical protein